jgi:subtilase family serine protease
MKFRLVWLVVALTLMVGAIPLQAQKPEKPGDTVLTPDSSIELPEHVGHQAHTNHVILVRAQKGSPAISGPSGETPTSLRAVYNLTSSGGGGVIAIVDAYDYPTAESDLNAFSQQFGLPACTTANGCLRVVYATGKKPKADCGWAQEAALDIEWAHAMSPYAKIILVEANSSSFSDLLTAVDVATSLVKSTGGAVGEVSMSWGGSEFSSETSNDSHFHSTTGVVYFAASGDTGGKTIYPGTSPYVVCAGGTRINRNSSGVFQSETGWSGSGGGPSAYESLPNYQNGIVSGSKRGVPDLSFDADPASGVSVYDSTSCQGQSGWMVFGGTSVASPSLAGIINLAGHFYASSIDELSIMYSSFPSSYGTNFRDITSGTAGKYSAKTGWDYVTGIGSSLGQAGK